MKLLLVDDESTTRSLLGLLLARENFEVIEADNGADAWTKYRDCPTPVVLSDWVMPRVDGLELCRRIRESALCSYTYFILLTGRRTSPDNYHEALLSEVDDFLTKPTDPDEVRSRLSMARRIAERLDSENHPAVSGDLLPVCMYCKRVHDEEDHWQSLERYMEQVTGREITHGLCPDCYEDVRLAQAKAQN